jgi:hypothetical protein
MDFEGMDMSGAGGEGGMPSMEKMQEQQQAKAQYEEQKANILVGRNHDVKIIFVHGELQP